MKRETIKEWAIILGGSKGLGLATAQKLAAQGMSIICIHRDRKAELPNIHEAFHQIRALGVQCLSYNIDALHEEKSASVIEDLKTHLGITKIKVLVHSIAKGNLKPMVGADTVLKKDDFQLTIHAMAISLYEWVQRIFNADLFATDSRVISFTSEGNTKAWQHYAAVSAAKTTLEAITRNIALEFAPHGIKANCIQAGTVLTDSLKLIPDHEKIVAHSIARNPHHRLTTPQDVANVVALLCSDDAAWINGCVIPVNGGEHLQ